jgi:hypothetical protein
MIGKMGCFYEANFAMSAFQRFEVVGILFSLVIAGLTAEPVAAEPPIRQQQTWLEQVHAPMMGFNSQIQPSASCAATACHGGPRPGRAEQEVTHGAEYPLWLESDPHAQSWKTIVSPASIKMMERLKIIRDGKIVDAGTTRRETVDW